MSEQLGDLSNSLLDYSAALRLNPENLSALRYRAKIHGLKSRYESELNDLVDLMRISPSDVSAIRRLVVIYAECEDSSIRNATKAVFYAQKLDDGANETPAEDCNLLSIAYAASGQFELAVKWLDRAMQHKEFAAREGTKATSRRRMYLENRGS